MSGKCGRLKEAQIDAAARRVIAVKRRRALWASADRLRQGESLAGLARARRQANQLLAKHGLVSTR